MAQKRIKEDVGLGKPKAAARAVDGSIQDVKASSDPFALGDADLTKMYEEAHAELTNKLGGRNMVKAQEAGSRPGAKAGTENIAGVYVGRKFSNGKIMPDLSLVVQVKQKLTNKSDIASHAEVPPEIWIGEKKIKTDVVPVGDIVAFGGFRQFEEPARCGCSVGNRPIRGFTETGTLGALCVVDGYLCLLSNMHVFAPGNEGREATEPGDPNATMISHPGASDSNDSSDIGRLLRFVEVYLDGRTNYVDCAVATTAPSVASPAHHWFRINPEPIDWFQNQSVKKEGRSTDYTEGIVQGSLWSGPIEYLLPPSGSKAYGYFERQIVIRGTGNQGRHFSEAGDSGSLIVDLNSNRPVGLLCAGSTTDDVTLANPIDLVKQALRIERFLTVE